MPATTIQDKKECGVNINTAGMHEHLQVQWACADGDCERLKRFIKDDAGCVNKSDFIGIYPLHYAALNDHVDVPILLLSRGASVNNTDRKGQTALHWGSQQGSMSVIGILLCSKADHRICDHAGQTAAHVAAKSGRTSVLLYMALKWAVDIDTQDNAGQSPLHLAAQNGHTDSVRLLVALDARCSLTDSEGCTPLHLAAAAGARDVCRMLLQGGSKSALTAKDKLGYTPFKLAFLKGRAFVAQQLHIAENMYIAETTMGVTWKPRRWLKKFKLCVMIWALIIIFTCLFMYLIMFQTHFPLSMGLFTFSWSMPVSAVTGLYFLFLTTTTDPGRIPTGWQKMEIESSQHETSLNSSSQHQSSGRDSCSSSKCACGSGSGGGASGSSCTRSCTSSNSSSSAGGGGSSSYSSKSLSFPGQSHTDLKSRHIQLADTLVFAEQSVCLDLESGLSAPQEKWTELSCGREFKSGSGRSSKNVTHAETQENSDSQALLLPLEDTSLLVHKYRYLDSPALWCGNWSRLCVTCRVVRPLRAKHDSVSNRCIEVFDHFCPFVGNAIGKGNRHFFVIFLWIILYSDVLSAVMSAMQIAYHAKQAEMKLVDMTVLLVIFLVSLISTVGISVLACMQTEQIRENLTTNEMMNWHRYTHMMRSNGEFTNPFDKGSMVNCWEVFHPSQVDMAPVHLPNVRAFLSTSKS